MSFDYAPTNDTLIRKALRALLEQKVAEEYADQAGAKVLEELGVAHGAARVDLAIVNGVLHGYEIKSDLDSLDRLPDQMHFYNEVFDHVTLVVGKSHLHEAIKAIPEWWGVVVARMDARANVSFLKIREDQTNPNQNFISIASLLWRREALDKLEHLGAANGVKSKKRQAVYERLVEILEKEQLKSFVRESLCARTYVDNWAATHSR